nr:2OG-Fe(II) oxygenase [Streptomyces sp. F001]
MYGKGQFFLPHQDSEKDDAMVGTLVLCLPSAHTGGELVIEHAGQHSTYRASKTELTLIAFYADCRHEVTPVRSGCRCPHLQPARRARDFGSCLRPAPRAGALPGPALRHARQAALCVAGPRPAEPAGVSARPRVHAAGPELGAAQGRRRRARRAAARRRRTGRLRIGARPRRGQADLGRLPRR